MKEGAEVSQPEISEESAEWKNMREHGEALHSASERFRMLGPRPEFSQVLALAEQMVGERILKKTSGNYHLISKKERGDPGVFLAKISYKGWTRKTPREYWLCFFDSKGRETLRQAFRADTTLRIELITSYSPNGTTKTVRERTNHTDGGSTTVTQSFKERWQFTDGETIQVPPSKTERPRRDAENTARAPEAPRTTRQTPPPVRVLEVARGLPRENIPRKPEPPPKTEELKIAEYLSQKRLEREEMRKAASETGQEKTPEILKQERNERIRGAVERAMELIETGGNTFEFILRARGDPIAPQKGKKFAGQSASGGGYNYYYDPTLGKVAPTASNDRQHNVVVPSSTEVFSRHEKQRRDEMFFFFKKRTEEIQYKDEAMVGGWTYFNKVESTWFFNDARSLVEFNPMLRWQHTLKTVRECNNPALEEYLNYPYEAKRRNNIPEHRICDLGLSRSDDDEGSEEAMIFFRSLMVAFSKKHIPVYWEWIQKLMNGEIDSRLGPTL